MLIPVTSAFTKTSHYFYAADVGSLFHIAVKTTIELENVSNAKALQLEAARRRAVPIRFNFVARA